MSRCIRGREVVVAMHDKGTRKNPETFRIVFPAHWRKAQVLWYVRAEHPEAAVRIAQWHETGEDPDPWRQRLWLANPDGFRDYARGLR